MVWRRSLGGSGRGSGREGGRSGVLMLARPLILGLLPLLPGCVGHDVGVTSSTVRDSAGVRVVESTAPRWTGGEGWRVDPGPLLDLTAAGSGPEHEFFGVSDAMRRGDGSLVVVEDGSSSDRVRFYAADGAFQASVGGTGDAPGEFRRPVAVDGFQGDSLAVYDLWTTRATVLTADGRLGRVLSPGRTPGGRVNPFHPVEGGGFVGLVHDLEALRDATGPARPILQVVRFSETGAVVDTVATVRGPEVARNAVADIRPLFGGSARMAVGPDRIVLGSSDSLAYRVRDAGGRLRAVVRVPGFDLSLSREEIEAERAAYLPEGREVPPAFREMVEALPAPDTRPAYDALEVDATGAVWARVFRGVSEQSRDERWRVFAADGTWLGTVAMPSGFRALEMGGDYVLGVWSDTLGVEHPRVLPLRRGAPEGS